jgi:hypothetical protein
MLPRNWKDERQERLPLDEDRYLETVRDLAASSVLLR